MFKSHHPFRLQCTHSLMHLLHLFVILSTSVHPFELYDLWKTKPLLKSEIRNKASLFLTWIFETFIFYFNIAQLSVVHVFQRLPFEQLGGRVIYKSRFLLYNPSLQLQVSIFFLKDRQMVLYIVVFDLCIKAHIVTKISRKLSANLSAVSFTSWNTSRCDTLPFSWIRNLVLVLFGLKTK